MRKRKQRPRQRQQQNKPWWKPPQKRGEAVKQAYLETRPEYLPVKRQLRGEMAASNRRVGETGSWFDAYLQEVSGQQAATQQAYADAASQTQGLLSQASALDSGNTARLNQEAAQSAALRGQVAPTSEFTGRANAAQAQRNYLGAAAGAATAQRGANQYAYLGEQKRIGTGQKIKSMMDERARGRSIGKDLLAAKKEQGAQASKNLREMSDRYREELLKRQAFNLDKQSARADAAEAAADRRLERERFREDKRHNRAGEADAAADNRRQERERREERGGGKGGMTPSERRDAKEGRTNAMVTARNLYKAAKQPPRTGDEWAAFTQLVAAESEISPQEAQWAVNRLRSKMRRQQQPRPEDVPR